MPAFAATPRLTARHAFVGNYRDTLLEIDADKPVQIASITKLITAWVVLNADLSLTEKLRVTDEDVRFSHYTQSSLPVGTVWRREELLEWLLVASDNRAAAALARSLGLDLAGSVSKPFMPAKLRAVFRFRIKSLAAVVKAFDCMRLLKLGSATLARMAATVMTTISSTNPNPRRVAAVGRP